MKCPLNEEFELREVEVAGVKVDICDRTGGVWFDQFEIEKFDEEHEIEGLELIKLLPEKPEVNYQNIHKLSCPRCEHVKLTKRFFGPLQEIEIDECAKCGGIWLDHGELKKIRELYPTQSLKETLSRKYLENWIQENKTLMEQEAQNPGRLVKIARALRWMGKSFHPARKLH